MSVPETESAQAAERAATAAAAAPGKGDPSNDPRLPWHGKPRAADIFCWLGIVLSGVSYWALLPLRVSLVGTHPVVAELLNGSTESIISAAAFARAGDGTLAVVLLAAIPGLMKFDALYWWAGRLGGRGAVFPAQGAGPRGLAAERRGRAGAGQLGGGEPGPGFLDDQRRGSRSQDRAAGAVPGTGDRGLVLAERGLRRAPPGQVRLPHRGGGRGLMVQEGGDHGAGLGGLFSPVAARNDGVVLGRTDREPVFFPPGRGVQPGQPGPSGSEPPPGPIGRLIPAFTRATTCPPASRIAVISS